MRLNASRNSVLNILHWHDRGGQVAMTVMRDDKQSVMALHIHSLIPVNCWIQTTIEVSQPGDYLECHLGDTIFAKCGHNVHAEEWHPACYALGS